MSDIVPTCTPYFFGISFYVFTKRVSRSFLEIRFCSEFCQYRNKNLGINKNTKNLFILHNKLCCPFLCISSNRMIVLSISESLHKRVEFAKDWINKIFLPCYQYFYCTQSKKGKSLKVGICQNKCKLIFLFLLSKSVPNI